jgi:hypothetical protein
MAARVPTRKASVAAALAVAGGGALAALAGAAPGGDPAADRKPVKLAEATAIVEVNDTEGDAGLQFFLDGDPWSEMRVIDPGGRKVLDVDTTGKLNNFGLTELFTETHEPPFTELSLERFKKRYPEGTYRFRGTDVDGNPVKATTRLSHDIPNGPQIAAPAANQELSENDVVLNWNPGPQPAGVEIEGYRVIIERENPFRKLEAVVPATVTSMTVPAEFLDPGTEYLFELQTIERSGNLTFSELFFRTS